jgi:hypothetical protein
MDDSTYLFILRSVPGALSSREAVDLPTENAVCCPRTFSLLLTDLFSTFHLPLLGSFNKTSTKTGLIASLRSIIKTLTTLRVIPPHRVLLH